MTTASCSTRTLLLLALGALGLGALHCGSTVPNPNEPGEDAGHSGHPTVDSGPAGHDDAATDSSHLAHCTAVAATNHVPTPSACPTTRPPGLQGDGGAAVDAGGGGACTEDSECTAGVNGRCVPFSGGDVASPPGTGECTYDQCSSAVPCSSGSTCVCGASAGANGREENTCLPADCNSDADCGEGGYCSPTYSTTCGPYSGIVGYYCHSVDKECTVDECVNDSDCKSEAGNAGYCAWDTTSSHWTCGYSFCAG